MNKFKIATVLLLCALMPASILFAQKEKSGTGNYELAPLTSKDSMELASLPELKLPEWLKNSDEIILPTVVDNSTNIYWRPVFAQTMLECGQASSVGLGFTYEINRLRNLPSNVPENQYATHFTWNFANGGDGWYGVSYFHSFEILRNLGNPNVPTYGGMTSPDGIHWMNGYNKYYATMKNRLYEAYQIDVSTPEGILTAKHWLHNHLEGSDVGGVANFYTNAPYGMSTLPSGTPEAGKYVVTSWGSANHALTISGYHDSICWDYNNDGQYTNNLDINNDGQVNVRDWEIGGFRFANTYSGGPSFGNNGFSYMTYKSCADPYGSGGIMLNAIHVQYLKEETNPLLTAKITLKHTCRNTIRVRMGVSTDQSAEQPDYVIAFPAFNFQGSCKYMQGGTSEADKTIEFGLDITPLLNVLGSSVPARYFLVVDEDDPNSWGTGEIVSFSVIDYTNGVNEIPCSQSNVPIINNSTTRVWVDHTVNFTPPEIETDTLPPATVYEPYSGQAFATGGTYPYIWDFDKNYTETDYTGIYPSVTAQQLNPGSNYATKSLGFNFPFAGEEYGSVRVYADGYIMFENELTWVYQVYDFLKFTKNKYIAPFMADLYLYPGNSDGVWYQGDGNSATFRWKASVNAYQNTSELNFAVTLFKSGDIKFFYGPVNDYPAIEWISGISAGDNKYYQFSKVNGKQTITPNQICDFEVSKTPEGFSMDHFGNLTGLPQQTYDNFEIKLMATDENFLKTSKVVYFSTDGANYLVVSEHEVLSGDDDIIEAGETPQLTVTIKNLGEEVISGVNMEIHCSDAMITLVDSLENLGSFLPGETKTFTDAFSFDVSGSVPNEYNIDLNTLIMDNAGEDWSSHIYLTAFAPDLYVGSSHIDDGGNGCLDPGESAALLVKIVNGGGATASDIIATLNTIDPYIIIDVDTANIDEINPYTYQQANFIISALEETPIGHQADFTIEYVSTNSSNGSGTATVIIGQTPVLIVDLDENSSSAPAMETALGNLGVSYDITTAFPSDLNLYSSIFLCLGIYSNNHVLTSNEGQDLADYLSNTGNLYMEGGDTWAYDSQTAVHPMFKINGESDGTSDLGTVYGQDGSFTEGMSFYYSGENAWIDHISPLDTAILIFENDNPVYGAAVAYDGGNYRTIGTSFEFGGLSDGTAPNTKEVLMTEYLQFFGVLSFDLVANFTASQTQICAGDSIEFSDFSTGSVNQWQWTFEGGEPATSTEQNPWVVYNAGGIYDVSLVIVNSSTSDTIEKQNYIVVYPNPGIPASPAGDENVCTNFAEFTQYTTAGASFADEYAWELMPEEAGTVSGSGATATVTWTPSWIGTATIRVKSISNNCGESDYSQPLEIACDVCEGIADNTFDDIYIYPNPTSGEFVVEFPSIHQIKHITVYNLLNDRIADINPPNNSYRKFSINLSGNPAGIYFIKMQSDGNEIIRKIVLE